MSVKEQIEQVFKEIDVYNSHALFELAKQRCHELMVFVEKSDKLVSKDALLAEIARKIERIEEDRKNFEGIGQAPAMSDTQLDVVKQLVCVPDEDGTDEAAWEVARACLLLGEYGLALNEFNRLIDNRFKPVSAAKHVLLCYIRMSSVDKAIKQYKEWFADRKFSLEQMEIIRSFLQEILYKNDINRLITSSRIENSDPEQGNPEDEFIDVIAIKLTLNEDSSTSQEIMLDVNYQIGSTFSVVVSKENQELADYLQTGEEIAALEMYSASIVFTGRCLVWDKRRTKSEEDGDYIVCLRVLEPGHA